MSSEKTQAIPQKGVELLLVSQFEDDHQQLQRIIRHSNWRLHRAGSQAEALESLRENCTPVVICESELPDGSWKEMHSELRQLPQPPSLVVTSRLADERLWSEVLNLGAYNVLAKPLDQQEVFHVVSLAWLFWKGQRAAPRALARTA